MTYHAVEPKEFSAGLVDVVQSGGGFTETNNNRIFIEAHSFVTGERVVYRTTGTPINIIGPGTLVNGASYFVRVIDPNNVQLATSKANATGIDGNGDPVAVVVLDLERNTGDTSIHSLRRSVDEPISNLVDGRVYFVRDVVAGASFKLSTAPGGAAIAFALGGLPGGGLHRFAIEGENLTSAGGAGEHLLVVDLNSIGAGKFDGIGGTAAAAGAPSGDRQVTASTTGVGGGFVSLQSATANAAMNVTTNLTIGNGANLSATDIIASTESFLSVKGVSDGAGGGAVALGDGIATASGVNNTTLSVANGAVLIARGDMSLRTRVENAVDTLATFGNGAFFFGAATGLALSNLQYSSQVLIDGDLTAGGTLTVGARASSSATADGAARTAGLGADGESSADASIGRIVTNTNIDNDTLSGSEQNARTRAEIRSNADLVANRVVIEAVTEKLKTSATAETDVFAAGANTDSVADARIQSLTEITLLAGSQTTGRTKITLTAETQSTSNVAVSDADLDALGGDTESYATAYLDSRAKVEGMDSSLLYTADLAVNVEQNSVTSTATAFRSSAWIDGGDSSDLDSKNALREIFWESTVVMLGEANPELVVDAAGRIIKKVNIDVVGGYQLGDIIGTAEIVIGALDYDTVPKASFFANALSGAPLAQVWGNAGSFEYKRTWDFVKITNNSGKNLRTNLIDVVAFGGSIDIAVDVIHGPTNSPANNVPLNPDNPNLPGPNPTFEFDLVQSFARTIIEIRNLQPGGIGTSQVILDGRIENPIGSTIIENQRGSILADPDSDVELVRTNLLDLSSDTGSIGRQASDLQRMPIAVELVRFRDRAAKLWDFVASADAKGDVVLDITAFDRADDALGGDFSLTVPIKRITAGDDVDLVVNDSKEGIGLSTVADIVISLTDPPEATPYSVEIYRTHFRPDIADAGLVNIRRAFGTDSVEINSSYDFNEVRAGDDIDIGHVTTTAAFGEARSYATTQIGGAPYGSAVTADAVPDTLVRFVINTDVDWTGGTSDDGVEQIFLTTNGDIIGFELAEDMYIGHVHSTEGSVTLRSTWRILDADTNPTIDVTGESITLFTGEDGKRNPGPVGGVGAPTDFLEVNTARNGKGGRLSAFDIAAPVNDGIFIDELIGDMPVGLIQTKTDVALRTVAGSVLDVDDDATPDVLGQSIDIDANGQGSSIGRNGNDLEIDSSRGVAIAALDANVDDVALEASSGIFLTETAGHLRLLMAHAFGGDIRLTVRESKILGEDFQLIRSGTARFAESNTRGPGNQADAERLVGRGIILTERGAVTLLVADNVALHQASTIQATDDIEIRGDYGNLDLGFGTTMDLRGRIYAGAVVINAGNQSGPDPLGVTIPTITAPVHATRIYADRDVDTINFGDATGITGGVSQGSNGYIFLGSETRVSTGGGEDRLRVFYLQDTLTVTSPTRLATLTDAGAEAARHTLTLDGEIGADTYEIFTLGSNGVDRRNYIVNVLDTGTVGETPDELFIYGRDSTQNGIDGVTGLPFATDDIFLLRAPLREIPGEKAVAPAYVALVHGPLGPYLDTTQSNEASGEVQRINYDIGIDGRLQVEGRGGNDAMFVDDTTVSATLDGGAGDDRVQVGQIFGFKRDAVNGGMLPGDAFPTLIPTTRGWLSPGNGAPLLVHGGTGNDQVTVYSNKAELRIEGDDGDDLVTVRAFALAQLSQQTPGAEGGGIFLDPVTGAARPFIGSTASPIMRAGGTSDEVRVNVNAPVSVDGGTGFDKLSVLGTEFADDLVVDNHGVAGAGLAVRNAAVEVLEVDGLEGDDEFYVQSTAAGTGYRVIGGLGTDAINVTGDVGEDIVTRELEGLPGAIDHLVTSKDPNYQGVAAEGFGYNVAGAQEGLVVISETAGFTAVREGGPGAVDFYTVRLARALMQNEVVYVAVSATRSAQEEASNRLINPGGLANGPGDSIWLSTQAPSGVLTDAAFQRSVTVNGVVTKPANRAVVLRFDGSNWQAAQSVFVYAPNDTRAEGERVVAIQHAVIAGPSDYSNAAIRNVEVTVRDNDTPGVQVFQIQAGSYNVKSRTFVEDGRTLVVEGTSQTRISDQVLVQLSRPPAAGKVVVVDLGLSAESDEQVRLSNPLNDVRMKEVSGRWQITYSATDWSRAVLIGIEARDDARKEDPAVAVINFTRNAATTDAAYVFPNFRAGPQSLTVEVIDNDTAGVLTLQSNNNTLLIGGTDRTQGTTELRDGYGIRLTQQPTSEVKVALLTDGLADVVRVRGVAAVYEAIGTLRESPGFDGDVVFKANAGLGVIERGEAFKAGSFIAEGFRAGELLRISNAGALSGDYVIASVSADRITLTTGLALAGPSTVAGVTLSELTRYGLYEGQVSLNAAGRELSRLDGKGWLADGFLEGQRVRLTDGRNSADFKIALIVGSNETRDTTLVFTSEGGLPAWIGERGNSALTVVRIAAMATFDTTNWFVTQSVELAVDQNFALPPVREGVKVYPASLHLLSKLRGPVEVEGGVTGADRTLEPAAKLPGEKDGYAFVVAPQPPESQQVDTLNIFGDGSLQNLDGKMDATGIRGLGMADGLNFGLGGTVFGETGTFKDGIRLTQIAVSEGRLQTSPSLSTIEVVNLMLGQGDDGLDIAGTLNNVTDLSVTGSFVIDPVAAGGTIALPGFDWIAAGFLPGQRVSILGQSDVWVVAGVADDSADPNDNSLLKLNGVPLPALAGIQTLTARDPLVESAASVTIAPTADGGTLTRTIGNWLADGLLAGHLITMGTPDGVARWRIAAISLDGKVLTLEGAVLTAEADVTRELFVQGPHGGLTLVHGGGNQELETTGLLAVERGTARLTRMDGLDWVSDRYVVGQRVQLSGEGFTRSITGFADATTGLRPAGSFVGWGAGATMLLSGPDFLADAVALRSVHVVEPLRFEVTLPVQVGTAGLTRLAGSWITDGFAAGQQVQLSGYAESFFVLDVTASALKLSGGALVASDAIVTLTVVGFDGAVDGGVRIGGDRLIVAGGGGPDSPLVLYGDTSQDGAWYAGRAHDVWGSDFGPKPYDRFATLAWGCNEDANFIFPLANPFRHAGNDVIEARSLFGAVDADSLPTVGITAYGGAGADTIIGSQAGDHLAGGSGDDVILGLRGADHIYGDSGVNVDISTRALFITTVDASPAPELDPAALTTGTTIAPAPSPVRDRMQAGRDTLYGEGDGTAEGNDTIAADIIFGDHGVVVQKVADPNLPPALLQKIQTTALSSVQAVISAEPTNGAADVIFGNDGDDTIVGGPGNDAIDGGGQADTIFNDGTAAVQLRAAAAPVTVQVVALLGAEDAVGLLQAARARWAASGLVSAAQLAATEGVTIAVVDLPERMLGFTDPRGIVLDGRADGHGWFVDATPLRHEEFLRDPALGLVARDGSAAAGRIDLLSVLVHELGHVMGLAHDDDHGAMGATLDVGRRLTAGGAINLAEPPAPPAAQVFDERLGAFLPAGWAGHLDAGLPAGVPLGGLAQAAALAAAAPGAIDWSRGWGGGLGR